MHIIRGLDKGLIKWVDFGKYKLSEEVKNKLQE
jgi:hypothetical protein